MIKSVSGVSGVYAKILRNNYEQGVIQLGIGKSLKNGINGFTDHAIPSYIIAVPAWEAYLYETILSDFALSNFRDSYFNSDTKDHFDNLSIEYKSIEAPKLLFGNTFTKGSQPFQDFKLLISIRNSLVHFKFDVSRKIPKSAINDLCQRDIFLCPSRFVRNNEVSDTWTQVIASLEGIRWAYNTIGAMVKKLKEFVPTEKSKFVMWTNNFHELNEKWVEIYFYKNGVDSKTKDKIFE